MNTLYIDIETYSPIDVKRGVYRYAEAAEVLLFAYAWNDKPVRVWDCTASKSIPDDLEYGLMFCDSICAHNSNFDRVVLESVKVVEKGRIWRDTMVRAFAHGLPGGLDRLSVIFKLPVDQAKDKEGRKLIHLFCKPQKNRDFIRATSASHPAEWKKFIDYAGKDIEAMRALDKVLPWWNDTQAERDLWQLDQTINDRGFAVDTDLARAAITACEAEKSIRDSKTRELTDGAVNAATQRDALLKHILEIHGVELPDMTESTLSRRLDDPELPEPVKELIALRLQSARTSTKKYTTLINAACSDNRLRGTLQFCGANRTGRWAGRIFQPQNLTRPQHKPAVIETGIDALKTGVADLLFDDVTAIASSALRGSIIAPPGKKLVVADLSSIEGRVLAWLANEKWKIKAYQDYDAGEGYDMYVLTYSKTFNCDPAEVTKSERQLGKVLELALGYGGGVGAFLTFANGYGVDLEKMANDLDGILEPWAINDSYAYWAYCLEHKKTLDLSEKVFITCDAVKRQWRQANAMIEAFWNTLEYDVRNALTKGYATQRDRYTVDKKGSWLRIKLPSGRYLCYAGARVDDENKIRYLGVNQYSRKWGNLYTYSGKIAENITQAASRDIMAHGMALAESKGYKVVLSVHDELLTETPDLPEYNSNELSRIMSVNPTWASDIPLAAAGFEAYRYRKD